VLRENKLEGRQVELEVTERVLMSGLDEAVATLKAIGELGVRFAIDDFGTGYSSLAYLRQLPIDKLKIDRSFLGAIDLQPADAAIVRAITALASTLGISVAAEGVESAAQLERLLSLGCEEWQGHYFSPPLDTVAFEELLSSNLFAVRRSG
jgi:EAL domain-containing protein (putative c-di-GMP-specific phosphodiesterase class I)